MLDIKNIEALLEKYWNAETNDAEEADLRNYMLSNDVHADFTYAVPFFKKNVAKEDKDINTVLITKLLDKYFEAYATVDEEALIREFFAQENVHASLRQYKSMFNAFSNEAKVAYNKPLILKKENTEAKVIEMQRATESKKSAKVVSFKWMKTAAAAFIGLAAFFVMKNMSNDTRVKPTMAAVHIEPETPEEALKMTMQALAMVSRKYKKGEQHLYQGMKTMNETNIIKE